MKKFILFTIILLLSGCAGASYYSLDDLKSELKLNRLPEQSDFTEADAVILKAEHDTQIKFTSDYDLETFENVHIITKLLKNIEKYSQVEIEVGPYEKISGLSARTIKADGSIVELKPEDFHIITGYEDNTVFYSDLKTIKFTFPGIEKNCYIEYKYTMYDEYPFLNSRWDIQDYLPVLKNSYKLTLPTLLITPRPIGAGWQFRYKPYNCDVAAPEFEKNQVQALSTKDEFQSFTWVKENIPALRKEPNMPSFLNYAEFVQFSRAEWKGWSDVAKFFNNNFFAPKMLITESIRAKATALTANCNDELAKVQSIYNYVQSLRYIAISLGTTGGYTPNAPDVTMEKKYGDCKDKAALLVTLLKSIGIKANMVLVRTSDRAPIDTSFPIASFNHAIAKVTLSNGKYYFLDGTEEFCKVGELPPMDAGINVLVVGDDGTGKLERTPDSSYLDNIEEITAKVNITEKNEANFNIKVTYKGEFNLIEKYRFKDKTQDEIYKFCKTLVADDYLNAEIYNCKITPLDSLNTPLTVSFDMKANNAISKQGDLVFINVDPFKLSMDFSWLSKKTRLYDVDNDYQRALKKSIEVSYPSNYSIRNLPEAVDYIGFGAQYQKRYVDSGDGKFSLIENVMIKSRFITTDKYTEFRKVFEGMQSNSNSKIVLTAK